MNNLIFNLTVESNMKVNLTVMLFLILSDFVLLYVVLINHFTQKYTTH